VVAWRDGDVVAERQLRYGAVVLSASPLADPPREQVVAALLDGIAQEELRPLPWTAAARGLRDRLHHLHLIAAADGWPAVDDATLVEGLHTWLAPFLTTARRRRDLADVSLADALMARVPHALGRRLDDLAPTHLEVPSGSRVRVDYSGEHPVLAVKLQEMFGATTTPEVAGAPVLVHLLSPAGRPLQVTRDLAGFWTGSYAQVRAEMRGRYPKHPWPEDPTGARPTRHTTARRDRG
jgi:ATP-dependent helicase HrpB